MASNLPDWQKIFNAGQATSTWKTICDRGRRTSIRWTRDEVFAGSQGVLRGLFLDLEQDLKPRLQMASGLRAVSVYADVIRLPRLLSLSGIALVLVARRIEAEGAGAITLDYRQGGSARLVLYTSEIVGDVAAVAVRKTGSPERLPISTPESAGVWISDAAGKTKVEPRAALPVEWLQDRTPAWQMVISAFQMATVLMGTDTDVARAMLGFIVRCAKNAPDNARFSAEWKELGRVAARLQEQGAEGPRIWAREYARQLFRGIPGRERARRSAELEHADKAAREGSPYELVKGTAPCPDPDNIRYVRHGAQTVGTATQNGWEERPVRRVSLSGAEIVLDDLDRTQFRATYSGQEDIKELVIHADTLVIKTGLRFPHTDVSIYCRTLYFEGKDAYLDTTPVGEKLRSPLRIDGLAGESAGKIVLHIQRFATTEADARHFRTCGGPGQDPDEGGFQTSDSVRHLRTVTQKDWDDLFQYANRKIADTTVDAPSWSKDDEENVVYVELKLQGKVVGSKGEKAEPGTGGKGLLAGRPGNGGAGGDLESTVDVARYADLSGGPSGTPLGPTSGADGGTPEEACWLFFEEKEEKGIFVLHERRENKKALKGPSSAAGPFPTEPKGRDGSYRSLVRSTGPSTWLTPVNLGVAVQFARDALAAGYPAEAGEFLAPYLEELKDGLPADAPTLILQWLQEARDLGQQSVQNVDPYGNPPGWVPLLSLESAVDVYERIVKSSMQELYTAYYLQRAWDSKADRQAALKSLSRLLSENTEATREELAETRDLIRALMTEQLPQLLHEMEGAEDKLQRVEREIKREADYLTADEERKAAVAGALKILGAVLKAIPLPEPYQAATAGLGTIFDVGGGFVEGASDAAFKNLKEQVDAFADENTKSLVDLANKNLETSLGQSSKEIAELQKKAEAANKENAGLRSLYGKRLEKHEKMIKDKEDIYEVKKKALLYGRSSTKNREDLVKKAGDLTKAFQDERDKMQQKLDDKTKEYQEKKDAIDGMHGEIEGKKKAFQNKKNEAAEQKEKTEKWVADGLKKVQTMVGSIESIHKAVGRLMVPSAELNSRWDKAVSTLKTKNPTFQELTSQLAYLAKLKTDVTTRLARLQTELTEQKNQISSNLVTLNELSMQLVSSNDALAPEVETYVQTLGQDAHRDLQQFLYYVVKAYEYHTVEPWTGSPQDARRLFDDMRNVLEPTNFKYVFDADPEGEEKRKRLEALLAKPEFDRDGMLSKEDFNLLKVVYEKPLRDMGKQLLKHLLQGGMAKQASFSVTLRAEQLKDLNERIDLKQDAEIPFDLIRLRQVDQSKERQRIANIKVTKVICRQLGQNLPDSVTFRFTQAGKALIRAQGRVYAFEPEGGSLGERGRATARVSFETFGGNSEKGRWSVEKERAVLSGDALWQPTPTREDNLLNKLLPDGDQNQIKTLQLSEFRPGVFSDFVLKVEVKPPEARIKLEEIELQITTEGVNAPQKEWLVCATSNVGLAVPFSASKPDAGGHSGGLGRYVGVFSGQPVQIRVPKDYGTLEHKGWEIDGERIGSDAQSVEVSKSAYVVAIYALAKQASAES